MISLDAATVLLQWATGGMLFCWFTTRRREVGLTWRRLTGGGAWALGAGWVDEEADGARADFWRASALRTF